MGAASFESPVASARWRCKGTLLGCDLEGLAAGRGAFIEPYIMAVESACLLGRLCLSQAVVRFPFVGQLETQVARNIRNVNGRKDVTTKDATENVGN